MLLNLLPVGNMKAQNTLKDSNSPVIKFEMDTINYGTIMHNADGFRIIRFVNAGKEPLLIVDIHTSCGCLVASGPKEPISSGSKGEIRVHYATERIGYFLKSITVISNAINSPKILVVKGKVLPDPGIPPVTTVNK